MKKLTTALFIVATLVFCASVSASETALFTDGSEYFQNGSEYATGGYIPASEDDWGLDTVDNMYPLTGIVTDLKLDVKPGEDLVTITCANGNMFSWYAPATDCWELYDLASCIMDSNGTARVYDDEVILAHYAGSLDQLAKYTAE